MADGMMLTALDIETDTSDGVNGLDPSQSRVVAAALAFTDRPSVVFDDSDETALLSRLESALATREGLLVTWNGAGFDLPFLAYRFAVLGLNSSLMVRPDESLPLKYPPPPVLGPAVHARWGRMGHVDICFPYREYASANGVSWSLKPVARELGLSPVEVDRTAMHLLTAEQMHAYVVSDVEVTIDLAARLGLPSLRAALTDL